MREVHIDQVSNGSIQLEHKALTTIVCHVDQTRELEIIVPAQTSGSCLLIFEGHGECDLHFIIQANASWSFLCMNESQSQLSITEKWDLYHFSSIQLAVGELTQGQHIRKSEYHLLEEGASLNVRGASLVQSTLQSSHSVIHHQGNTSAQVDNYSIVLKGCEYKLEIIGKINRAAKGSKTHQISRVMNFDEKPKTTVNPKLIIDENEVEASHAASMGQPDINQVYYLQSRGLSRSDSLKLMSLGYLLPIVQVIDNEAIREKLTEAVHKKVSESCLM